MPSSSWLSSPSVMRQATSINASFFRSRPVISQSIHTRLSFIRDSLELFPSVQMTGVTARPRSRMTGKRGRGRGSQAYQAWRTEDRDHQRVLLQPQVGADSADQHDEDEGDAPAAAAAALLFLRGRGRGRSEEHTSELQSR